MADVFVSYQKSDQAVARRVVKALTQAEFSVWWDDRITPVESWDRMIEREIQQAKCVLVLWSPRSVESEWVRIEANFAKMASPSKLIQVRIEACEVPIAFSLTQFADAFDQNFSLDDPEWKKVLEWVRLYAATAVDVGEARVFESAQDESRPPASPAKSTNATSTLRMLSSSAGGDTRYPRWVYACVVLYATLNATLTAGWIVTAKEFGGVGPMGLKLEQFFSVKEVVSAALLMALLWRSGRLTLPAAGVFAVGSYAGSLVAEASVRLLDSITSLSGIPALSELLSLSRVAIDLAICAGIAYLLGAFRNPWRWARALLLLSLITLSAVGILGDVFSRLPNDFARIFAQVLFSVTLYWLLCLTVFAPLRAK